MESRHLSAPLVAAALAPARATFAVVRSATSLPTVIDDLAAVIGHLRRLTAPTGELTDLFSAATRLAAARQAAIEREAPRASTQRRAATRARPR